MAMMVVEFMYVPVMTVNAYHVQRTQQEEDQDLLPNSLSSAFLSSSPTQRSENVINNIHEVTHSVSLVILDMLVFLMLCIFRKIHFAARDQQQKNTKNNPNHANKMNIKLHPRMKEDNTDPKLRCLFWKVSLLSFTF
jgi:hypothetical protein